MQRLWKRAHAPPAEPSKRRTPPSAPTPPLTPPPPPPPPPSFNLHHERQVLRRCGLHAVNALHGGPGRAHTARSLAALSRTLSAGVPAAARPRPATPLGDYGVALLTAALAAPPAGSGRAPLRAAWLRPGGEAAAVAAGRALVNVQRRSRVGVQGRHWLAVVREGDVWWVVDSSRRAPELLGGDDAARRYLARVAARGGHVLAVSEDVWELDDAGALTG